MSTHKSPNVKSNTAVLELEVDERNLVAGEPREEPVGIITAHDVEELHKENIPPEVPKNPPRGMGDWFTPDVKRTLNTSAVRGYFGTRVDMPKLLHAEQRYSRFDDMRTRIDNTAAVVAQICAPDGQYIEDQIGKIMNDWDDLTVALPREALALEPLHTAWMAAHPGRKATKATKNNKSTATEGESARSATTPGASASGSTPTTQAPGVDTVEAANTKSH